jgi:hypothetical protein
MRGVEPDVGTVKEFGAPCMVKVPDQKRHKLNLKAEPGRNARWLKACMHVMSC